MISKPKKYLHEDLTFQIIGAAMEVHKNLGSGFLEAVYQEALEIEFKTRGLEFLPQVILNVHYKGFLLKKTYTADFTVQNLIIVEIKAIEKITEIEIIQVRNYLKATKYQVGLLINFGEPELRWKRSIYTPILHENPKTNDTDPRILKEHDDTN